MQENAKTKIIVISTGGTIEKTYDEHDGTLENRGPVIKQSIIERMRLPYTSLEVHSLFSKDSLHMTDADREMLCQSIKSFVPLNCPIVVLHGTDTMALSAQYCFERIKNLSAPVVFTGAMKPLGFDDSDATQNVTEALLACKLLTVGIYISFHNRIFQVPKVRKNPSLRTFESF